MKKYILLLFTAVSFAQVGIGTTTPRGALDIDSTTQGVVIPIVALTSVAGSGPVVNPQGGPVVNGTMVYNTTNNTGATNVVAGVYSWNGTKWVPNFGIVPINANSTTLSNIYEYSGIISLVAGTGLWNINISTLGFTSIISVQLTAERATTDIRFIPYVSMTASPTTANVALAITESNTITVGGQGTELSPGACNIHITIKGTK